MENVFQNVYIIHTLARAETHGSYSFHGGLIIYGSQNIMDCVNNAVYCTLPYIFFLPENRLSSLFSAVPYISPSSFISVHLNSSFETSNNPELLTWVPVTWGRLNLSSSDI